MEDLRNRHFGIQDGKLVAATTTQAEALAALDRERHYFLGYAAAEIEVETYRSKVEEAFRSVLGFHRVCAFWRVYVQETRVLKKRGIRRIRPGEGLKEMLAHAFLLPYVMIEDETKKWPGEERRFSIFNPGVVGSRTRKLFLGAFQELSLYERDLVPLLASQDAMRAWILRALSLYVLQYTGGRLNQRFSDEDLEEYRWGTD